MTQHTNLSGSLFIAASQSGFDRATRQFGNPSTMIQDQVDATNFVLKRAGVLDGSAVTPRSLIAVELAKAALAILRCQEGQELGILAKASADLAVLATQCPVPMPPEEESKTDPLVPPRPTLHTPESNRALETRPLPIRPEAAPKPEAVKVP